MRGGGATYNTLYADDSDDDSDGFGCVFPKDGGFDTGSDGSDFSNLADDLFEKASVDSFEYVPPSKEERSSGSGYNRAKLDMDGDDVSVGSDTEFQRASKSNKRWDWVEADEESVGSDDDFEVQFEGRGNSVYDLKAGQGDVEDFLGGGGGEDLNEDFEFHTDFADAQRAEAFFNEGTGGGVIRAGQGRGGTYVSTGRDAPKAGARAAAKRNVDPKFIRAQNIDVRDDEPAGLPKSSGKSKSAALIAAGLAQAAAKKGGKTRFSGKVQTEYGEAVEAETIPVANRLGDRVVGAVPVEKAEAILKDVDDEERAESDEAAKGRIERSLQGVKTAIKGAITREAMERVEDKILSEIDNIGEDIRKGIRALERRSTETTKSRVTAIKNSLEALEARIESGLSLAEMIHMTKQMMILEHKYNKLRVQMALAKVAAVKREQRTREREKADEGDDEAEPARLRAREPLPAAGEPAAETPAGVGKVVGPVELISLGSRKKAIKFSDSAVRIDSVIELDKLEALLKGVKSADGDADAKKEIVKRLKRAISTKKLESGLRQKRAPSGFLKGKAGAATPASVAEPDAPRPRGAKNLSGLTQAQRSQRAK